MTTTITLARAAARDAANRRMALAGRTVWTRGDYNAAARVMNRLLTIDEQIVSLQAATAAVATRKEAEMRARYAEVR